MELHENAKQWLETATKGIRFGPDRREVEAELREHIEDKTADMARIFRLEGEEAETEALKRMGDPVEIGRELARLHKPWLGYLWNASLTLLGIMILVCAFCFFYIWLYQESNGPSAPGPARMDAYAAMAPVRLEPEQVELGGYTFRIMAGYTDHEQITFVVLRVSSPRFWEPVDLAGLLERLEVVLDDGTRVSIPRAFLASTGSDGISPLHTWGADVVWGSSRQPNPEADEVDIKGRWWARGLFYQDINVVLRWIPIAPGERITLEIDYPMGKVRLSAVLEEAEI